MSEIVSIIILAYNSMEFLPLAIKSALAQSYSNTQIIVVNDGSTDDVVSYVKSIPDARVSLINQQNQGPAAARNAGMASAKGRYIAFLDGDDLWEPTKLEEQVRVLDAKPAVGLSHTGIRYIDEQGNEVNQVLGTSGDGNVWREVVLENPVRCGSTPVVRAECFATVGKFDTTFRFSEDWDMWLRIAKKYQFSTIDKPLTLYRQHKNNMTKNHDMIMNSLLRVIDKTFEDNIGGLNALKRNAVSRAYLFAAWRAFLVNDYKMALRYQAKSYATYPTTLMQKNNLSLIIKEMQLLFNFARNSRQLRQ